jgi:DNA-binding transcriptional MocR family regulator
MGSDSWLSLSKLFLIPTPTFNGQLQLIASLKRQIIEIPAHHRGIDLEIKSRCRN